MKHNWRWFGFLAVLLGALAASAARAEEPAVSSTDNLKKPTTADLLAQLEKLNAGLKDLTTRMKALETNLGRDLVDLQGKGIQTEINAQKALREVNELRDGFAQMRKDLDALNNRLGPSRQISAYAGPTGAAVPTTGRIRLVNTYLTPQTFVLNGKAYEVAPNQVQTESVPAGVFSYEVLGVQPRQDRVLAANETFTVHVHTR